MVAGRPQPCARRRALNRRSRCTAAARDHKHARRLNRNEWRLQFFKKGRARSGTAAAAARTGATAAAAPVSRCTSSQGLQRLALAAAEGRSLTPCWCCTCVPACWKYVARAQGLGSDSYLESVKSLNVNIITIITADYFQVILDYCNHYLALLHWHYYHITTCY